MKRFAVVALIFVSVVLVVAVGGALAFGVFTRAQAARAIDNPIASVVREVTEDLTTTAHRGRGAPHLPGMGLPFLGAAGEQYLADALGITVEELQAAQKAARAKALDQALEEAVANENLTQKQADAIRKGSANRPFLGMIIPGKLGLMEEVDYKVLLADELGITTDELNAAIETAQAAAIAQAVEDGKITQEQADWILAQDELREYIDPQAILAQALGITTDELQALLDEGKTLYEIVQELGLSAEDVSDARYQAYKDALAKAVSDGVITQEQADQLLLRGGAFGGGLRMPRGFNFGDRFERRGDRGFRIPFGEASPED